MTKVDCKHWIDSGIRAGGDCAIGAYRRPSFGVCVDVCKAREPVGGGTPQPPEANLPEKQLTRCRGCGDPGV